VYHIVGVGLLCIILLEWDCCVSYCWSGTVMYHIVGVGLLCIILLEWDCCVSYCWSGTVVYQTIVLGIDVFVYCVSYDVRKTLLLQKSSLPCQTAQKKRGGSVTVLPEFLEYYLLLYAAYSW
jgi:hypothetical protein